MPNILITGTSRGIGLATARAFLRCSDYQVLGTSTSGNPPIWDQQYRHWALHLDQHESIRVFVQNLLQDGIRLDGIINNAAVLLEEWDDARVDMKQLKKTFAVNVFGAVEITENLLPILNAGAHIINVSSGWGTFSDPGFDHFQPHYKMSKAALNMYTRLLAERLSASNITVSAIDPGWVQTDMGTAQATTKPEQVASEIVDLFEREVPTGRFWYRNRTRNW